MTDKDETPVIIYNGAMYGAPPLPSPRPLRNETPEPTATIPCVLIGGSILVVLAIVCLLAGAGIDWLQAVR